MGAAKILAQHPWTRPERVKKSPAPLLQAASKAMRQVLGFALFVAAYRAAADKLKRGDPNPGFPRGCFPPATSAAQLVAVVFPREARIVTISAMVRNTA